MATKITLDATIEINGNRTTVTEVRTNKAGTEIIVVDDTGIWAGTGELDRTYEATDAVLVKSKHYDGYCAKCGTYCYGDCEANEAGATFYAGEQY